ncbi:MAG: WS/DGAT/MGAT family O-acyltransferase [Panacagrimonas sp.]
MNALSTSDALFLLLEGRRHPMHVAGLQLYSMPEGAGPEFARELAQQCRDAAQPVPPFSRAPVRRLGRWHWQEDTQFDIDYHLRHSALPHPGRIRELLELVSRLHGTLQDRTHPLWEMNIIEGLNDGRVATYLKLHHSMFDGVGAMRTIIAAHSTDPDARNLPPIWARAKVKRTQEAQAQPKSTAGLIDSLKDGRQSLTGITRGLWDIVRKSGINPADVTPFQAPPSILNPTITGARRVATQSWSLARLKALSKKAGVTLNDVVLTVCSGALREYLLSQGALPEKSLVAMVPVSVRSADGPAEGNQVAMMLVDLATDAADPVRRLRRIAASSRTAKERMSQMSRAEQVAYMLTVGLPLPVSSATRTYHIRPPFNVVISNVPGPDKPMYWNGARLDEFYPVSLLFDGQALNITLTSYCDQLSFGFVGCRTALPHLQRLLEHTSQAIEKIEAAL